MEKLSISVQNALLLSKYEQIKNGEHTYAMSRNNGQILFVCHANRHGKLCLPEFGKASGITPAELLEALIPYIGESRSVKLICCYSGTFAPVSIGEYTISPMFSTREEVTITVDKKKEVVTFKGEVNVHNER